MQEDEEEKRDSARLEVNEEEWADGRKWMTMRNRPIVGGVGARGRMGNGGRWRRMRKFGEMMVDGRG